MRRWRQDPRRIQAVLDPGRPDRERQGEGVQAGAEARQRAPSAGASSGLPLRVSGTDTSGGQDLRPQDRTASRPRRRASSSMRRSRRPGLRSKVGSPTVHFHEHPGRRRPQARLRRQPAALHLHGGARPAARVDPRLRGQGAQAARGGVGADDVPRLRLRADGRAGAARALLPRGVRRPGRRLLLQPRPGRGDDVLGLRRARDGRRGPHGHGDAAGPPVRHGGAEAALPRARRSPARRSPASGSPSPTRAPTSPASAPARSATATSG